MRRREKPALREAASGRTNGRNWMRDLQEYSEGGASRTLRRMTACRHLQNKWLALMSQAKKIN